IAPYLCLRCSDMAYLTEAHRSNRRKIPTFLVDFPINHQRHKEWTVKYVAENLRRLVKRIGEMGGREATDEDLRIEIKLINRARKLARDYVEMWWKAPIPPASSVELQNVMTLGNDFVGDPAVGVQVLEEAYGEIKERVENSVKGMDVAEDPVRLFLCGSCGTPNSHHIDRAGGAVVGYDDWWNRLLIDVEEDGDPYENLAKAMLSFPYELPTEERALWTAEQAKKAKADGLIFAYNWGCNNQSAVARMVCDIVKKEINIPTMPLELGELGRTEATEQSQNRVESFIEMLA
ncbi:MAG: 2-hydroxyacyl-CoA dehydratase family protein, partial [Syntrophales bacterium]|nr:2-hydroxyacyl-CoA dehydratase family protein [Syntrophales bacterium]